MPRQDHDDLSNPHDIHVAVSPEAVEEVLASPDRGDADGPREHELRTWPEYFAAVLDGRKGYELRRDDRGGFRIGDVLHLREYDPATGYTGRETRRTVSWVSTEQRFGLAPGFACLGLAPLTAPADARAREEKERADRLYLRAEEEREEATKWWQATLTAQDERNAALERAEAAEARAREAEKLAAAHETNARTWSRLHADAVRERAAVEKRLKQEAKTHEAAWQAGYEACVTKVRERLESMRNATAGELVFAVFGPAPTPKSPEPAARRAVEAVAAPLPDPAFVHTDEYGDTLYVRRFPECWSFYVDPGDAEDYPETVAVKVPNRRAAELARALAAAPQGAGPEGFFVSRGGLYICDDKHADRTWWGPATDPFVCCWDTYEAAAKHGPAGSVVVAGPYRRPPAAPPAEAVEAWLSSAAVHDILEQHGPADLQQPRLVDAWRSHQAAPSAPQGEPAGPTKTGEMVWLRNGEVRMGLPADDEHGDAYSVLVTAYLLPFVRQVLGASPPQGERPEPGMCNRCNMLTCCCPPAYVPKVGDIVEWLTMGTVEKVADGVVTGAFVAVPGGSLAFIHPANMRLKVRPTGDEPGEVGGHG